MRPPGEDDHVAMVEDAEALSAGMAEGALSLDRLAPFRRTVGHVDMRAAGAEFVALVLQQTDVAEEVEQLRLGLVEAGARGDLDGSAAGRGQVALGLLERDNVVGAGVLPRHIGGDGEGPVLPVDAAVPRLHHAHILRLAQVELRRRKMDVLERVLYPWPGRDEKQQHERNCRQNALRQADETAVARAETRPRPRASLVAGRGGSDGIRRHRHAMPARRQSWICRMPSGRRFSSTANRLVIAAAVIWPSASAASACGRIVLGRPLITLSTGKRSRSSPMWRRKSPSVTIPMSLPESSVTPTQPKLLVVLTRMASAMAVLRWTSGMASPSCMMSATRSSFWPSWPPG